MRKKEVKKLIGKENWEKFYAWIRGQSVEFYKDGSTNYFKWDVDKFITKLKNGYDSQKNEGWD